MAQKGEWKKSEDICDLQLFSFNICQRALRNGQS